MKLLQCLAELLETKTDHFDNYDILDPDLLLQNSLVR